MDTATKSALMKRLLTGCFVLILAACSTLGLDDVKTPHVFSGNEVPQEALDVPRVVKVPEPLSPDTPWPRLGDVPPKPHNFTSKTLIQETFQQMENDRDNAKVKQQEVESEDPPELPHLDLTPPSLGPVSPLATP